MPSKTPPLFNPSASDDETDFNVQDFIDELEKGRSNSKFQVRPHLLTVFKHLFVENFDLRKDWDEHKRQMEDSRESDFLEFAGLFDEEPATAEQPSFTSPMSPMSPMSPSPPTDAESSSGPDIEVVSPPSTPWPSKPKKQDSDEIVEARLRCEEAELKAARKLQDILAWNVLVTKILDDFEHPVSEIRNSLVQGVLCLTTAVCAACLPCLHKAYHPDKNTKNWVARTGHWAATTSYILLFALKKKDKRKRSETDDAPDSVPGDGASGKEPPPLRRSGRKRARTEAEESTEQAEGYGEKSGSSGSAKNMPSKTPPLFNPSASDDETDFNMQDFIDELEKGMSNEFQVHPHLLTVLKHLFVENFDLRKDWDEHEQQKKDSQESAFLEFASLFNEEPATAEHWQPSFTSPMSPMSPSPPTDDESSSEPDIEVVSPPSTPWPSKPKKQDSEEIVEARLRREEAELKVARKLQDILVWNVLVAEILDDFEHPVSEIRNSLVQGIKSKSPREQFYALQRAYHSDKNTKNRFARTGHWAAVCEEITKALNLRAPHRRRKVREERRTLDLMSDE
ncbi:hypothetical protein OF83DRAFT_1296332 [Amylostereum chailletii]|nr:hypothetical protein OF83DRAFT_1296332 [Amylostereum chailletii]